MERRRGLFHICHTIYVAPAPGDKLGVPIHDCLIVIQAMTKYSREIGTTSRQNPTEEQMNLTLTAKPGTGMSVRINKAHQVTKTTRDLRDVAVGTTIRNVSRG